MTCAVTLLVTCSEGGGTAAFFGTVQHDANVQKHAVDIQGSPTKQSTTVGCFSLVL